MAGSNIPKRLKEALKLYEREGFTVASIERRTKHYRVIFHEFPEAQFMTASDVDGHAYKNNLALYRRLRRQAQDNQLEKQP